jgi:hypothetical protein
MKRGEWNKGTYPTDEIVKSHVAAMRAETGGGVPMMQRGLEVKILYSISLKSGEKKQTMSKANNSKTTQRTRKEQEQEQQQEEEEQEEQQEEEEQEQQRRRTNILRGDS